MVTVGPLVMQRVLALLLLCSVIFISEGRPLDQGRRGLLAFATCPAGCQTGPNACVQDATAGGLRCQLCQGNLLRTTGGQCACSAGSYYSGDFTCTACSKGSYCPGGPLLTDESGPEQVACPDGMTTLGMRAPSVQQCVNLPGYFYTPGNVSTAAAPTAAPCPPDTWSRGLRKQRQCVNCFPGFTTQGANGSFSSEACVVSPGFYTPEGTSRAVECPPGTFKSEPGAATACTACPGGVTTTSLGSTSLADCTVMLPGVYPVKMNGTTVLEAKFCPQKFYCEGGVPLGPVDPANLAALNPEEPTIKACPEGTWTYTMQAASVEECLTPPGFFTAGGVTTRCPDASYRAEWAPPEAAESCNSCGEGVFGSLSDTIEVYDPITEQMSFLDVQTEPDGCYIKPGMGLYRTEFANGTSQYYARNCDSNSYGVAAISYGFTIFPCRECPDGMVASTDKVNYPNSASHFVDNGDGTKGFNDPRACVTKAGFGYDSRRSNPCPAGTYNDKDNYDICKSCPYGTSTAGAGLGVTVADCKVAPSFGFHSGQLQKCPLGTYNDVLRNDTTSPCTQCPTGRTSLVEGADSISACQGCKEGYGGPDCTTPCGGVGAAASYGPAGRAVGSECVACSVAQTGYSFSWMGGNDPFAPRSVAKLGAASPADCLAEFVQVQDHAWELPYSGGDMVPTRNIATTAACAALCTGNCMFFTYDYQTRTCFVKNYAPSTMAGAPFIAFKTELAGDVGANSVVDSQAAIADTAIVIDTTDGNQNKTVEAQALASGSYVFYQDASASAIGIQTAAPGAASFTRMVDCEAACSDDNSCAGFVLDSTVSIAVRPTTCKLVKGDNSVGVFRRSMIRADVTRLQPHSALLG